MPKVCLYPYYSLVELDNSVIHLPDRFMIKKMETLQHRESCDFGCHPCEYVLLQHGIAPIFVVEELI